MPPTTLRPRSGSELIDAAIQLYRQHFTQFAAIAAIALAPYLIVNMLVVAGSGTAAGLAMLAVPGMALKLAVLYLFAIVCTAFNEAAVMFAASQAYLGRPMDASSSVLRTLPLILRVVVANLLKYVIIGIGFVFLVVPGIYLYTRFFAVPGIIPIERRGIGASFRRSEELARGSGWKILGTIGLSAIGVAFLGVVINMICIGLTGSFVAAVLAQQLFAIFVGPLVAVITTLVYYDMRIRKEALDIEMMTSELGGVPAGAPA